MFKYNYEVDLSSNTSASQIINMIKPESTVLEIGCATGYMTKVLKNALNCKVIGIEIDAEAAQSASAFCHEVYVGNIETFDLAQLSLKEFDYIIFADVLEHLKDPLNTLEKIKPILKTTGSVLASIPNIAHAAVILNLFEGNFDYRKIGLLDNTHLRFFTKKTIYSMFERAGFIIEKLSRTVMYPQYTEFVVNKNDFDSKVVELLYQRNSEANTYQFIIKAVKSNEENQLLLLNNKIEEYENMILDLKQDLLKKEESLQLQINYSDQLENIIKTKDLDLAEIIKNKESIIGSQKEEIEQLKEKVYSLENEHTARDKEIMQKVESLHVQIEEYRTEIGKYHAETEKYKVKIEELNHEIEKNKEHIVNLNEEKNSLKASIDKFKGLKFVSKIKVLLKRDFL